MSQRYNDNIKRLKLQDIQLGILKVYAFCWKISRGPQVRTSCCYAVSLWEYAHKLSGLKKGAVGAQ